MARPPSDGEILTAAIRLRRAPERPLCCPACLGRVVLMDGLLVCCTCSAVFRSLLELAVGVPRG